MISEISYIDLRLPQRLRQRKNAMSIVGKEPFKDQKVLENSQRGKAQNSTAGSMEIQQEHSVKFLNQWEKVYKIKRDV